MITLVEALQYRSFRYIRRPLGPFHVIVGPNASGKSNFLDIILFVGTVFSTGLEAAIAERLHVEDDSPSPTEVENLLWGGREAFYDREGRRFAVAIEAALPDHLLFNGQTRRFSCVRYELLVDLAPPSDSPRISFERLYLTPRRRNHAVGPAEWPCSDRLPASVFVDPVPRAWRAVLDREYSGFASLRPEPAEHGEPTSFRTDDQHSAVGSVPLDEERFAAALWFRDHLIRRAVRIELLGSRLHRASARGAPDSIRPSGSSLPWIVDGLRKRHRDRFTRWIRHVRTAVPEIRDVDTLYRPDLGLRHLVVTYADGLRLPSWSVSEGTLRLLALTVMPYVPDMTGIYLIEEPENGIHPRAIETVFQSLSSVYDAQVLLVTHSPMILNMADLRSVLTFAKTPEGATDIVSGDHHPSLRDWHGEVDLGTLFAGGVLG